MTQYAPRFLGGSAPYASAPPSSSTYAQIELADSPLAYYRLDESSGTTALDLTTNNNDGTYSAGVTLGQAGAIYGDNDAAVLLNGTAGHVSLPAGLSTTGLTAFSVSAWVKFSNVTFATTAVIAANDAPGSTHNGFSLQFAASAASVKFLVGNGTTSVTLTDSSITYQAGVWYHVAGTWDGATAKLWVNGQSLANGALSGSIGAAASTIGLGYAPAAGNNFFPGLLDEVSFFNTALANGRIAIRYISGLLGTATPTPVNNPYGFNLFHPSGQGVGNMCPEIPQILADMRSEGCSWLRYQIPWQRIETQQSPVIYVWDALDAAVYAANRAGINLNFNIFSPPSWQLTRPSTDGTFTFADITGSATFASAIAARYNGIFSVPNYGPMTIAVLEMGNEDYDKLDNWNNQPNTQQTRDEGGTFLAPVMVATVPAVAAVNGSVKVYPACVLEQNATHIATWLAGYYGGGAGPYTLMTHFHFYKSGGNPPTHGFTFDNFWQAMQAGNTAAGYPKMDVWVTETGWPTNTHNHSSGDVVSAAVQWSYWSYELDDARLNSVVTHIIWYEIGTNDGDSVTQGGAFDGTPETYVQPTWANLRAYILAHPTWGAIIPVTVGNITIGNNAVALIEDSILISPRLDERWQATFTVIDYTGTQFFQYGEQVSITDPTLGTLYSGFVVDDKQDKSNTYPDATIEHQITCVDNFHLVAKRTSDLVYVTPTPAGKIVTDMVSQTLSAEGIVANYATQTTSTQADWATGTLSNVTAATTVGDGDLELTAAAGSITKSFLTQASWAAGGTLAGVVANTGGDLSLNAASRNWTTGGTANQTLFGNGSPTQRADASGIYHLTCSANNETRSRLDFAGKWGDSTITLDMYLGGIVPFNSFEYRTTNWNNNDSTYAYAIEANLSVVQLKIGSNGGTGQSTTLASHSFSPTMAAGWYTVTVTTTTTGGHVQHVVSVGGTQCINYTQTGAVAGLGPYTAAGYIGIRNRNLEPYTLDQQYDNFGVVAGKSGTWTSSSSSLAGITTIANSVIEWDTSLSTGGTITVQASIDGGSTFTNCTSGAAIPGLTPGTPGAGKNLVVKVTLSTTTVSTLPDIEHLSWQVQAGYVSSGTRISGPFDLSPVGRCGSSFIGWNVNLPVPPNTTLGVDVSPDGVNWTDVTAQNGGQIPFVNGEPDPTIDGFDTNTSANYFNVSTSTAFDSDTFAGRTVSGGWGTASGGHVWALAQGVGTISVSGGKGRIAAPVDSNILILGSGTLDNGTLTVRVTQGNATTDSAVIYARYQGVNNWYRFALGGQVLSIQSKVAGTFTTLVQAAVSTTAGTLYWLAFDLNGPTLSGTFWADGSTQPGQPTISISDTTFSSGEYGLGGSASTTTPVTFDSFTVFSHAGWAYFNNAAGSYITGTGAAAGLYLNSTITASNIDLLCDMDVSDAGGLVFNAVDSTDYYSLVAGDSQASVGTPNLLSLYKTASAPSGVTPLTLYGQNTASTTLSTANILSTATGTGTTLQSTKVGKSTGFGEAWSQGTAAAWPALSAPSAPTGHGFLWDVSTLEGKQLAAGNWQPVIRLTTSVGNLTADIHVRAFIFHANATYTQIGADFVKTSQTISTTNTIFTLPNTALSASSVFGVGDKLYYDVWPKVLSNNTGSNAANLNLFMATAVGLGVAGNAQLSTPGYQTPGGGTPTTTLLGSAPVTFIRGLKYRIRATNLEGLITCSFDGDEVISYLDPAPLGAGNVGVLNNGGTTGSRYYQLWVQPMGDILTGVSVYTRQRLATTDTSVTPQLLDLTVAAFGPQIGAGTLIPSANYQYTFCDKNMDDLAKQSNYHWYVDPNKVLYFNGREGTPAPWIAQSNTLSLPSDIEADSNLVVEVANDLYRNRQVLTGVTNSGTFTDTFVGDGARTSFTLRYPVAPGTVPTITLDSNNQKVGTKGNTGSQWYYAASDPVIAEDTNGPTLTLTDTLIVTYTGTFLDTVVVDNTTAQSALAAIEGGTGIIEAVEDVSQKSMTYAAALVYANQLLVRYCVTGRTLTFKTYRNGLQVGQILSVFFDEENLLDVQMLITQIDIGLQTQPNQTVLYNYLVTASELPPISSYPKLIANGLLSTLGGT